MTPQLIAGPGIEPVSLDEAKLWLRSQDRSEDDLIQALIVGARLVIEGATRRMLITQTWRLALDRWPAPERRRCGVSTLAGASARIFGVPLAPLQSIAAIHVVGADGVAALVPPTTYVVDASSEGGRVIFNAAPPMPFTVAAGVKIDVVAGYGDAAADVPAPLRQAILALVARWHERRGDDVDALHEPALPAAIAALVAPYRRARLT